MHCDGPQTARDNRPAKNVPIITKVDSKVAAMSPYRSYLFTWREERGALKITRLPYRAVASSSVIHSTASAGEPSFLSSYLWRFFREKKKRTERTYRDRESWRFLTQLLTWTTWSWTPLVYSSSYVSELRLLSVIKRAQRQGKIWENNCWWTALLWTCSFGVLSFDSVEE